MDKLKLRSSWDEVRERLKENDISLTDEDLEYTPGSDKELIERLALKMKKSTSDVREYIEGIAANEDKAG